MRKLSQFKDNTHTVKLYDIVTNKELSHVFIVMEYVETDLKKVLSSADSIEMCEEQAATLIFKILCALNYIHSANIIHRDLKPANILIDENMNLKLCDFGLARTMPKLEALHKERTKTDIENKLVKNKNKRLQKPRELSNHTQSRWYRAPEVILLEKSYNTKIDIWGAGCIIAEIL